MIKKFFNFVLILVCCLIKGSTPEPPLQWIPFIWQSDTISGKFIEKAYIYIPVKIENLPIDFTMQFDLGTVQTQFYGKTLKPFLLQYPSLADKLVSFQNQKELKFKNINLHLGSVDFTADIWNNQDYGEEFSEDLDDIKPPIHIGTIAPDLFQDKILIIDYKLNRIAITDILPNEYKNTSTINFELNQGIIILPFNIDGTEKKVMFDTGSSPFPLATSKENALRISQPEIVDSLKGPLWWGTFITFYGHKVNKSIQLGGFTFDNSIVYYDKEKLWEENVFKPLNIWGLTGNAYFLDFTVVLDYKNRIFRIRKSANTIDGPNN